MQLITILGLLAAAFTTLSFLPQAIKTLKTKQTDDLSLGMYVILTTGIFLWLLYGIAIADLPIMLANVVTLVLTSSILILIIRHRKPTIAGSCGDGSG